MTDINFFLSPRTKMIVSMARGEKSVCDIGTDHGYVAVAMALEGARVIAADVNEGPLKAAKKTVELFGACVETRLSDGFEKINEGEADCAVIAGMGGELIVKIMQCGTKGINRFVLQPQSKHFELRTYLNQNGFVITDEEICREDNRFYIAIKAEKGEAMPLCEKELRIGPVLLKKQSRTLKDYLKYEIQKLLNVLKKIEQTGAVTENAAEYERIIRLYEGVLDNG